MLSVSTLLQLLSIGGAFVSSTVALVQPARRDDMGFFPPPQGNGSEINQSGGPGLGEPLNVRRLPLL